jgi:hypothetical protein
MRGLNTRFCFLFNAEQLVNQYCVFWGDIMQCLVVIFTDVPGQLIGPIFKDQESKKKSRIGQSVILSKSWSCYWAPKHVHSGVAQQYTKDSDWNSMRTTETKSLPSKEQEGSTNLPNDCSNAFRQSDRRPQRFRFCSHCEFYKRHVKFLSEKWSQRNRYNFVRNTYKTCCF